jgi:hypothetical protein
MGSVTLHPDSQPIFPNLFTQSFTQKSWRALSGSNKTDFVPPHGALILIYFNALSGRSSKAENCFGLHSLLVSLSLPWYRLVTQKTSAQLKQSVVRSIELGFRHAEGLGSRFLRSAVNITRQ